MMAFLIYLLKSAAASIAVTKSAAKSVKVKTDAGASQGDMLVMMLASDDTAAIALSRAAVKDTLNVIPITTDRKTNRKTKH